MAAVPAHTFLPCLYIADVPAVLPLHSHVQPIRPRGHTEARSLPRHISRHTPYSPMPSMGRMRLRSRAMTPAPEHFDDIHAHSRTGERVLTSVRPSEMPAHPAAKAWYSIGIHPWDSGSPIPDSEWSLLEGLAVNPKVAAIGEAGLDAIRGGDPATQEAVFRRQAALAEKCGKFLMIHCVRRYGRLMELKRELKPSVRWIIHGFCGKTELARQLLAAGFELSLRTGCPRETELRKAFPDTIFFSETDQ